jgi:hypothetical protein
MPSPRRSANAASAVASWAACSAGRPDSSRRSVSRWAATSSSTAQGLYGSGVPAARAVGPAGLVPLVLTWSGPGWLLLSGAFAAAGLALAAVARPAARTTTVSYELSTGGSR